MEDEHQIIQFWTDPGNHLAQHSSGTEGQHGTEREKDQPRVSEKGGEWAGIVSLEEGMQLLQVKDEALILTYVVLFTHSFIY